MAPKQGKKNLAKFLGIDMSVAVADSKCAPSDHGKLTTIRAFLIIMPRIRFQNQLYFIRRLLSRCRECEFVQQ